MQGICYIISFLVDPRDSEQVGKLLQSKQFLYALVLQLVAILQNVFLVYTSFAKLHSLILTALSVCFLALEQYKHFLYPNAPYCVYIPVFTTHARSLGDWCGCWVYLPLMDV